jgi:glycosyltransferase involved in cell wall biosynthesis
MRPGKGVIATLKNFKTWQPPRSAGPIHLVLAGQIAPAFRAQVDERVRQVRQSNPAVELDTRFRPLDPLEWSSLMREADYLLLPYTRPLGSSGILGHAARAGKPVLATRQGLIGSLVRDYRLGATFHLESEAAWHRHLDLAVSEGIPVAPADQDAYLRSNSVESFQTTLARHFESQISNPPSQV